LFQSKSFIRVDGHLEIAFAPFEREKKRKRGRRKEREKERKGELTKERKNGLFKTKHLSLETYF
jgi:hypothetical protein